MRSLLPYLDHLQASKQEDSMLSAEHARLSGLIRAELKQGTLHGFTPVRLPSEAAVRGASITAGAAGQSWSSTHPSCCTLLSPVKQRLGLLAWHAAADHKQVSRCSGFLMDRPAHARQGLAVCAARLLPYMGSRRGSASARL